MLRVLHKVIVNRRGPLILIFGRLSHQKLKTKLFTKNKNKFECLFLQIKQFRLYQCFFHERKLVFGQTLLQPLVGKKSQLAPKIAVLSNKTMQGSAWQWMRSRLGKGENRQRRLPTLCTTIGKYLKFMIFWTKNNKI